MSRFGFKEENIVFLSNEQAKQSAVMDGVRKFQHRGREDRLLLFFSGRGYTAVDTTRKEDGFFVPFDGQVQSRKSAAATCISLKDLRKWITDANVKQTLVFLDFTVGGFPADLRFSGLPAPRLGFQRIVTSPSQEIFAAGSRNESLTDDPATGLSSLYVEADRSCFFRNGERRTMTGSSPAPNCTARTSVKVMEATQRKFIRNSVHRPDERDFSFHSSDEHRYVAGLICSKTSRCRRTDRQQEVKITEGGFPVASPKIGVHTLQVEHEGFKTFKNDFFVNGRVSIRATVDSSKFRRRASWCESPNPTQSFSRREISSACQRELLLIQQIENGKNLFVAESRRILFRFRLGHGGPARCG